MNNDVGFTKWNIVAGVMGIILILYSIIFEIAYIFQTNRLYGININLLFPILNYYIYIASVVFLCVILFMKKRNFLLLIPFSVFGLLEIFYMIKSLCFGFFNRGAAIEFIADASVCIIGYFVLVKKDDTLVEIMKKLWFFPSIAIAADALINIILFFINGDVTTANILDTFISPIPCFFMYLFVCKWIVNPYSNESERANNK